MNQKSLACSFSLAHLRLKVDVTESPSHQDSCPHVLIGTPGRMLALLREKEPIHLMLAAVSTNCRPLWITMDHDWS